MAMEMKFIIHEAHTRAITAMGLNAHRKELWVAGRDGVMRIFDCNTGKLRLKLTEHTGHVTSISYYAAMKAIFSTGIDGSIITWTASGTVYDKVFLNEPIYNLEIHARRRLALVALKQNIRLFYIDEWKESGHVINMKRAKQEVRNVHDDVIKKIVAHDLKVFSVGLDGALCMYEFPTFICSNGGQITPQPQQTATNNAQSANVGGETSANRRKSAEGATNAAPAHLKASLSAAVATHPLHLKRRVQQAHGAGITDVDICRSASQTTISEENQEKDQWVVITSSYDHTVRIWTSEIRLITTVELPSAVLSLAFCIDSQFVWVCSEHHFPACIDPRTFENITEMKSAFHEWQNHCVGAGSGSDEVNQTQKFEMLRYFREFHTMVGVVDARDVVFWKFNPSGAFLCMKSSHPTECIAVTEKPPNFIVFTGDANGSIIKFENPATSHNRLICSELDVSSGLSLQSSAHRQQQTTSKSKQEIFKMAPLKEVQIAANPNDSMDLINLPEDPEETKNRKLLQFRQHPIQKLIFNEELDLLIACNDDGMIYVWGYTKSSERNLKANKLLKKNMKQRYNANGSNTNAEEADETLELVEHMLSRQSDEEQRGQQKTATAVRGRKPLVNVKQKGLPPAATNKQGKSKTTTKTPQTNRRPPPPSPANTMTTTTTTTTTTATTLSVDLEQQTRSSEMDAPVEIIDKNNNNDDANNNEAEPAEQNQQPKQRLRTLSEEETMRSILADREGFETVLNRVAGFTCKHVLWGHDGTVSGLACCCASRGDGDSKPYRYLLSTGWDRRICLWDLEKGLMLDLCKRVPTAAVQPPSTSSVPTDMEYVADAQITDIDFCPSRGEFAYSSMDGLVYIRRFHVNGRKMTLLNALDGYKCPVITCRYHPLRHAWLTAGEDCSIRMWSADDFNPLLLTIDCGKKVQVLSIDKRLGPILAGVSRELRIYDSYTGMLLQTHKGHRDNVSGIAHVAEADMYVTVSWDTYVRAFNALSPSQLSRRTTTASAAAAVESRKSSDREKKNSITEPKQRDSAVRVSDGGGQVPASPASAERESVA